jgi:hypothetical protein
MKNLWFCLLVATVALSTTACATKSAPSCNQVQHVVIGAVEDAEALALAKAVVNYRTDPAREQEDLQRMFKQMRARLKPAAGIAAVPIGVSYVGGDYHFDYHPGTKALVKAANPEVKPALHISPSPTDSNLIYCSTGTSGKRLDLRVEKTKDGLVISRLLGVWYID